MSRPLDSSTQDKSLLDKRSWNSFGGSDGQDTEEEIQKFQKVEIGRKKIVGEAVLAAELKKKKARKGPDQEDGDEQSRDNKGQDSGLRRSERKTKAPYGSSTRPPLNIGKIEYGPLYGPKRGASRAEAFLGPLDEAEPGDTSHPPPKTPSGIEEAQKALKDFGGVKAGHLINATFGGANRASNLTILTSSANVRHQTFDNNVRRALIQIGKLYEALHKKYILPVNLPFGVQVTIEVSEETFGPDAGWRFMAQYLLCTAELCGENELRAHVDIAAPEDEKETIKEEMEGHLTEIRRYLADSCSPFALDNTTRK